VIAVRAAGATSAILAACAGAPPHADRGALAVAVPAACRPVGPGPALQDLAADAAAGTALCLAPGRYPGPIAVAAGVTIWGPPDAVIVRPEGGSVVTLADRAALLGVTVDGSGGVFDQEDAAVRIQSVGARVEGVTIVDAVFGILADGAHHITLRGNRIHGSQAPGLGLRGDTIRLWETHDSVVTDNVLTDGRDMVVWYSTGNHIERNVVRGGRYGTHLMYSHHNVISDNQYLGDVVGVFLMYSRNVTLERNVIAWAHGVAGMGIGMKESGNITIRHNAFVQDQSGVYVDTTPLTLGDTLIVDDNLFGSCDTSIRFHASGHDDHFTGNDFIGNAAGIRVDGGGDATDVVWSNNYFDDYAGYDLDGDGHGDVPYQLRSLEGDLVDRRPDLAFFRGTAALGVAEAVTRVVPMYPPRTLLVDPTPRMGPHAWGDLHAD
jgi:nitrous oxidase accessory protein